MAVQFFSHVGICVSDLPRSRRFYRDGLGFAEMSQVTVGAEVGALIEVESDALTLQSVFLERDGSRIELMEFADPGPEGDGERGRFNTLGLTHMAFRTDDLAALTETIREHGGIVLDHTRVGQADMGVELIYVLDPDGVRIELIQLPGDPTVVPGEPINDP